MKKILSKKYLFFIIITSILLLLLNYPDLKKEIKKKYPNLSFTKHLFKEKSLINNISNDYNEKFLPVSQFTKLSLKKNKINFRPEYYSRHLSTNSGIGSPPYGSFFIEIFKDNVWLVDYLGGIYKIPYEKLSNKKFSVIDPKIIKSNFSTDKVLDTLIHEERIYISYVNKKNECKTINIASADINKAKLDFVDFYKAKECGNLILGGRMVFYEHNKKKGIIVTTHGHTYNEPDNTPQNDKSIYGKNLFIDFEKKDYIIFSKGHRVAQGLYTDGNIILQTEHGPRGGDEINSIFYKGNYGWPIASYGEKYGLKKKLIFTENTTYAKDHYKNNFIEPIYSFIPSIGISEIIKLPHTFSNHFKNNFILSSLNSRHLYRIKFNSSFKKIIYKEKIFIKERVRDLKFHKKLNLILMAFEENGEIGILSID
jgi:hypothetical protein